MNHIHELVVNNITIEVKLTVTFLFRLVAVECYYFLYYLKLSHILV